MLMTVMGTVVVEDERDHEQQQMRDSPTNFFGLFVIRSAEADSRVGAPRLEVSVTMTGWGRLHTGLG